MTERAHSVERWYAERDGKKMGVLIYLYADDLALPWRSSADGPDDLMPVELCRGVAKRDGLEYQETTELTARYHMLQN
jgi:hypothetical protein